MNNLIKVYNKYAIKPESYADLTRLLADDFVRTEFVNAAISDLQSSAAVSKRSEIISQLRGMAVSKDYDFSGTIAAYICYVYTYLDYFLQQSSK